MKYKNYLTTPSGRYCEIADISNGDYFVLVKYLQSENYPYFFRCLDEIVKRDLPDFDDFDIVDKCYVYLAYCMYSIRGSISVNNKMIGDQEISISTILNNIENTYVPSIIEQYKLTKDFTLSFGYPTKFVFEGNVPLVDFYSGLKSYNDVDIKEEDKIKLRDKLGTKNLSFIDDYLREKFQLECDIFNGVPMNSLKINLLGESLIANVVSFYRLPLNSFYQILYVAMKHIRMSYNDFMKISHVETTILMNCAAEENKKMSESSKGGDISTIGRMMDDLD